eukprot:CAMPEP_0194078848 /NCGR_PEP_ID=MMETSP0149-20130528/5155_1 /TAXON_ID=122233 /ORGANISM="Chaetoceros debilis, Strain MM31A-1" /LENGTH=67 /DNA_ID=CAMNT_0038760179 /DNA_START=15 /DNA_END=218 /DNA_ORIENTATION=-
MESITALSNALNTGLDQKSLASITTLLSNGVHPDALAALIVELRRDAAERGAAAKTAETSASANARR